MALVSRFTFSIGFKRVSAIIVGIVSGLAITPNAEARVLNSSELKPFAKQFSCKNPKLQWQFDNLTTLWDENEKMAAQSGHRTSFITDASGVGGNSDWLYRGVTNQQFNESQILALIFNDEVSVSESRWFSGKMFEKAAVADGQYVARRDAFRSLPEDHRWDAFKQAYLHVHSTIESLLSKSSGSGNGFSAHILIGGGYNGTPQAIQFLTPHLEYAEGYGEFVLYIRESVKRGVDVERYNYHYPGLNYQIGSIYAMDRNEYLVPSHIPSWDIQSIKVRNGTGWHQRNYGPPIYYYTKLHEPENPCNVLGIRVDAPASSGADSARTPLGVILKCPKSADCVSKWGTGLASEARLRAVIESTKVDDQKLAFLPMAEFSKLQGDSKWLKDQPLNAVIPIFSFLPKELLKDTDFWKTVFVNHSLSDPESANALFEKLPAETRTGVRSAVSELLLDLFNRKKIGFQAATVKPFLLWIGLLDLQNHPLILQSYKLALRDWAPREALFSAAQTSGKPDFVIEITKEKNRLDRETDPRLLKPSVAIKLLASKPGTLWKKQGDQWRPTDLNLEIMSKGIAQEPEFSAEIWNLTSAPMAFTEASKKAVAANKKSKAKKSAKNESSEDENGLEIIDVKSLKKLSDTDRIQWVQESIRLLMINDAQLAVEDPFQIWKDMSLNLPADLRDHVLGMIIEWAISSGRFSAINITRKLGEIGLPKDREIDTLRSVWQLSKAEPATPPPTAKNWIRTNSFALFADAFVDLILKPQIKRITQEKVANHLTEAQAAERIKQLRLALVDLSVESLRPPTPFLGYAALTHLRQLYPDKGFLFWPIEDPVKYTLDGMDQEFPAIQYKSVLSESLSFYLISSIYFVGKKSKDEAVQNRVYESLKALIPGFIDYAIHGFSTDLNDPFIVRLLGERFAWNRHENTAGLMIFLAEFAETPEKAAILKAMSKKLNTLFPTMKMENPWIKHMVPWKAILKGEEIFKAGAAPAVP